MINSWLRNGRLFSGHHLPPESLKRMTPGRAVRVRYVGYLWQQNYMQCEKITPM